MDVLLRQLLAEIETRVTKLENQVSQIAALLKQHADAIRTLYEVPETGTPPVEPGPKQEGKPYDRHGNR